MKIRELMHDNVSIPLSNLVIVVGPNGSGKTTFLTDLHFQFTRSSPGSTVSTDGTMWCNLLQGDFLEATQAEWEEWRENLVKITDASAGGQEGSYSISGNLSHEAKGEWLNESDKSNLINAFSSDGPVDLINLHNNFGMAFKSQQSYYGTVDNRMWLSQNASGTLSATKYSSQLKAAPYLATNKEILKTLNVLIGRLFGKRLFAEAHNYPSYTLDIASTSVRPPRRASSSTDGLLKNKEFYAEWKATHAVQGIQQEGHGIRATAELLYAFENKSKKINFIDEPELHLYPSTKYSLGKVIANYSMRNKQIILVTHDTEMLRGLVFGSRDATVLRINSKHQLSFISANEIGKAYSSDILQGAFQDGVVIVEGITDKYVYSNALSDKHFSDDYSLQVVSMYGKGSLAVPIPFYESLNIKNAVIADFDIIFQEKFKDGSVRKHVIEILKKKNVDETALQQVEMLLDEINRFLQGRADKNSGLNCPSLSADEKAMVSRLLNAAKRNGLFIVPYGGLESWVRKGHEITPEQVLSLYKSRSNSTYMPLTKFLAQISGYLKP